MGIIILPTWEGTINVLPSFTKMEYSTTAFVCANNLRFFLFLLGALEGPIAMLAHNNKPSSCTILSFQNLN